MEGKKKVTLICPRCRYGDDYYVDEYEIYDSSPENPYKVKCHHCKEEWGVFQISDLKINSIFYNN